jgi:hypothetical protein
MDWLASSETLAEAVQNNIVAYICQLRRSCNKHSQRLIRCCLSWVSSPIPKGGSCSWWIQLQPVVKLSFASSLKVNTYRKTGIWLTQKPNEGNVHCDRNVVGATFLLTTSDVTGSMLCNAWKTGKIRLSTWVLSSWWFVGSYTLIVNLKVDNHPGNSRTSWTLYLDARVFSKRYKCVHNVS